MNLIKIPKYQLYLLQLENYELGRYLRLVLKKGLLPPKEGLRKSLVWTPKAILIFLLAEILILAAALFAVFNPSLVLPMNFYPIPTLSEWGPQNWGGKIVVWLALVVAFKFFSFVFLSLAVILLTPLDWLVKSVIIYRAKRKIKGLKGVDGSKGKLIIIGIAGSYGKTTMKEVLGQVLGVRFKVRATPESVNTPVGVARWTLKKFDDSLEVAIVEMGEHYRGDIIELCKLTPPDIAVITGINEAHLERMGSVAAVEATIFEIIDGIRQGGFVVLNGDDALVFEGHRKYLKPQINLEFYGSRQNFQFPCLAGRQAISNFQFNPETLRWKGDLGSLREIEICLLGEYALADCQAAAIIAKRLGLTDQEIRKGIEKIRPIPHRLEPKFAPGNILVIDDAYNGNSDGAREAIKVLSRFVDRRKIYITPGLVETGSKTAEIHREIGQQLAAVADVVILIRNSVSGFIEEGVNSQQSIVNKQPEVVWFDSAQEAHANLSNILKPNDVILFQNDWGDQYL